MKRFLTLTVFILLTLFVFVQDGYCLTNPVGYSETETPDGDDHPWGGDEVTTPPDPISTDGGKTDYFTGFTTGVTVIDYSGTFFDIIRIKINSWFNSTTNTSLKPQSLELKESKRTSRKTANYYKRQR